MELHLSAPMGAAQEGWVIGGGDAQDANAAVMEPKGKRD